MAGTAAVTFWLDNKQVTGVALCQIGPVKLVEYGRKIYQVTGKDPARQTYTKSTLPAKWKKLIEAKASGVQPEATPEPAPAKAVMRRRGVVTKIPTELQPEPAPAPPAAPALKRKGKATAPHAAEPAKEPAKEPVQRVPKKAKTASHAAAAVNPQGPKVEARKVKTPKEKKEGRGKAKKGGSAKLAGANRTLVCSCPYCKQRRSVSVLDAGIGQPQVLKCDGCKKEFVIRVVVAAYEIQVAGFV